MAAGVAVETGRLACGRRRPETQAGESRRSPVQRHVFSPREMSGMNSSRLPDKLAEPLNDRPRLLFACRAHTFDPPQARTHRGSHVRNGRVH